MGFIKVKVKAGDFFMGDTSLLLKFMREGPVKYAKVAVPVNIPDGMSELWVK